MKFRYFFISLIIVVAIAGLAARSWYRGVQQQRQARVNAKAEDVKVTFLEGWTLQEMAAAVEKNNFGTAAAFIKASQKDYTATFPLLATNPASAGLEGFLFPDTYRFAKTATADEIITTMLDNFQKRVNPILPQGSLYTMQIPGYPGLETSVDKDTKAQGLSFYQLITLASIVERESNGDASNEERRTVAAIFYNRLVIGQPLEADSTVNYITKKNSPSASGTDITIDSPYNTYKYRGLPPGPISNPSLASIKAALDPIKTDYYFFFHDKSGKVYYSKTFEEHRDKKFKYLNKQ